MAAPKGAEGMPYESAPNGKYLEPKAFVWEFPLVDGMEVDPTTDVLVVDLNKETEGMEIVPPPCTDIGLCAVVSLVEAMLPVVLIEGKRIA